MSTAPRQDLEFVITFHGPFRVASGQAGGGLDATVALSDPLPGSSLKGVMRDAALGVLGAPADLVAKVFGTPTQESPWAWTSATPPGGQWGRTNVAARVAIDDRTHTARRDMLVLAEVVEQGTATFTVKQRTPLPGGMAARHVALLRSAAAAVHHIGSDRRRGLGWVTITGERPITAADITAIHAGGPDA